MVSTRLFTLLGSVVLLSRLDVVSAQYYGPGYGYNNGGWRNVYIGAIVIPIIFIILCVLFWFFIFRSLCGYSRRRTSRPMGIPMAQNQNQPYAPQYGPQYGNQYPNQNATQYSNQNGNQFGNNPQFENNGQYAYAGSGGYQPPQEPPQAYTGYAQNQYYAPPPGQPSKDSR